jgi:hypothetical protein
MAPEEYRNRFAKGWLAEWLGEYFVCPVKRYI